LTGGEVKKSLKEIEKVITFWSRLLFNRWYSCQMVTIFSTIYASSSVFSNVQIKYLIFWQYPFPTILLNLYKKPSKVEKLL